MQVDGGGEEQQLVCGFLVFLWDLEWGVCCVCGLPVVVFLGAVWRDMFGRAGLASKVQTMVCELANRIFFINAMINCSLVSGDWFY